MRLIFAWYFYYLWAFSGPEPCQCIKMRNAMYLLNAVDGVDAEALEHYNLIAGNLKKREDATAEMDLMQLDTSDILYCFYSLRYSCFQRKILIYMDSLNRAKRVNLFGGYLSFIRTNKGTNPPITEELLAARRVKDENSLSALLRKVYDDFVDNHIVRVTLPFFNRIFQARSSGGNGKESCYEFGIFNATLVGKEYDTPCARANEGMIAMSSALMMKMMILFPTLLKIIAAKAMFGIVMGSISVILSKIALIGPYLAKVKAPPPTPLEPPPNYAPESYEGIEDVHRSNNNSLAPRKDRYHSTFRHKHNGNRRKYAASGIPSPPSPPPPPPPPPPLAPSPSSPNPSWSPYNYEYNATIPAFDGNIAPYYDNSTEWYKGEVYDSYTPEYSHYDSYADFAAQYHQGQGQDYQRYDNTDSPPYQYPVQYENHQPVAETPGRYDFLSGGPKNLRFSVETTTEDSLESFLS